MILNYKNHTHVFVCIYIYMYIYIYERVMRNPIIHKRSSNCTKQRQIYSFIQNGDSFYEFPVQSSSLQEMNGVLKEIGLNHGNTFIHYTSIYRRAYSKKIIIIINKDRGINNKRFSIPCFVFFFFLLRARRHAGIFHKTFLSMYTITRS